MWSTHVSEKRTMLNLKDLKFLFMLLVFKYKTEKESFEKQKLLLKSLGVQQCVSREEISW